MREFLIVAAVLSQSRWAPPAGSFKTLSTIPSLSNSFASNFSASAALEANARSFQRMAAHPSGEITE